MFLFYLCVHIAYFFCCIYFNHLSLAMKRKLPFWKSVWKYIIVFLFGVVFTFAITNGFTLIQSSVQNAVQFITETIFTDSGLDTGTRLMDINAWSGYIWINTWLLNNWTWWNLKFLTLNSGWNMIYAAESDPIFSSSPASSITSGNINNRNSGYTFITQNLTWLAANYYTTWLFFNSGNNVLKLYVSGYGIVTWFITMSGAANRNSAYNRINTTWNILLNSWSILWNRYLSTGIYINSLATATGINCAIGELLKFNGTTRVCSGDLIGSWVYAQTSWRTGNGVAGIYNTNTGNVGVGLPFPLANFQISGTLIAGSVSNAMIFGSIFSSILWWGANTINWSWSSIAWWVFSTITWSLSFIGWGSGNVMEAIVSSIVWWEWNCIECQAKNPVFRWDFIWGGQYNTISQSFKSSIVWWSGNIIQGWWRWGGISFIWWWEDNSVMNSDYGVIWGGIANVIDTSTSTSILGWTNNTWSNAWYSFIWWGTSNIIFYSHYSVIAWWSDNIISGAISQNSTIPWWIWNHIEDATSSFVAWTNAYALHSYSFVRNDGSITPFSTTQSNTFIVNAENGVGIDTATIATGVDIEINQVFRLKPQIDTQPFTCDINHEGSVFMYKQTSPSISSYLCYCGYWSDGLGIDWRSVSDNTPSIKGGCWTKWW